MLWKSNLQRGFNFTIILFSFLSNISPYKQQIAALRTDFWGNFGEKAYPSSKRNQKIHKLIYDSYNEIDKKFKFSINGRIRVCEGDIIIMILL